MILVFFNLIELVLRIITENCEFVCLSLILRLTAWLYQVFSVYIGFKFRYASLSLICLLFLISHAAYLFFHEIPP